MRIKRINQNLACVLLLAVSAMLFWQGAGHFGTYFQIRQDIRRNQKEVDRLTAQQEALESARENLDNPDYLNYYAPGKYFVTQDGAQVFKFPKLDLSD